jgi:putative phage-type endonuclease
MLTAKELKERIKYIGASEAAAVLGLSRWQTPIEIWAYKTGQIEPEDISDETHVWLGNELEETVAKHFCKTTGKKVHRVNEAYIHKDYDFLRCHIDRKVEGESAVLQCKTASQFKAKEWEGEDIPVEYIVQEYHELACSCYDKAYIYVLVGNKEFHMKIVERDNAVINNMIKKEVDFWNEFVIPKVMPETVTKNDSDILYKLFPDVQTGKEIILPDRFNQIKKSLDSINQDIHALEGQRDKLTNEIKATLKENEVGNTGIWKMWQKKIHTDAYTCAEKNYKRLFFKKLTQEV